MLVPPQALARLRRPGHSSHRHCRTSSSRCPRSPRPTRSRLRSDAGFPSGAMPMTFPSGSRLRCEVEPKSRPAAVPRRRRGGGPASPRGAGCPRSGCGGSCCRCRRERCPCRPATAPPARRPSRRVAVEVVRVDPVVLRRRRCPADSPGAPRGSGRAEQACRVVVDLVLVDVDAFPMRRVARHVVVQVAPRDHLVQPRAGLDSLGRRCRGWRRGTRRIPSGQLTSLVTPWSEAKTSAPYCPL